MFVLGYEQEKKLLFRPVFHCCYYWYDMWK